jgi:hypothetical protein
LVSTVTPLTLAAFRADPEAAAGADEAGALGAAGVLEVDELPHAAMTSATAAKPAGAHHLPRITFLRFIGQVTI